MKNYTFKFILTLLLISVKSNLAAADRGHLQPCDIRSANAAKSAAAKLGTLKLCDAPFVCDPDLKLCKMHDETLCNKTNPCPIGSKCTYSSSDAGVFKANKAGLCTFESGSISGNNIITSLLCKAFGFTTGGFGRTVIIIYLMILGKDMASGNIDPNKILLIILGVAVMFGAPSLVAIFTGKSIVCNAPGQFEANYEME